MSRSVGALITPFTLLALALVAGCSGGSGASRAVDTAAPTTAATTTSLPRPLPLPARASAPRYQPAKPVLVTAPPVRLDIPAIGVSSNLVPLGLEPDGSMEVPKRWQDAGWYSRGPKPGENGPAVIAGHVDSTTGPAVFFRLRELHAGDVVRVTRADHSVARFIVDRLQRYPKRAFPTATVFAPTTKPTLRLITCTGAFDERHSTYLDNLIVFTHPA